MSRFALDILVPARRLRDAVREIRSLPFGARDQKAIMAEWLQEHTGAAKERSIRHEAYDNLLGRAGNRRLGGGK